MKLQLLAEDGWEDCMETSNRNHNTIYASLSKVQSWRTLRHNDQKNEYLDVRFNFVNG